MVDPVLLPYLYLLTGLLLGGLGGWLWARSHMISRGELRTNYVARSLLQQHEAERDHLRQQLADRDADLSRVHQAHAALEADLRHLNERLAGQEEHFQRMQKQARVEFENVANRLLDQKAQAFSSQHHQRLEAILHPFREKIKEFEDGVEKRFLQETQDRISLKKEIEYLRELNLQVSTEANNLAQALKGDQKAQGDWGEWQLELLLERSGLQRGLHYRTQQSLRDDAGKQKRPDVIINLPEDKHLVIDSKVSLLAYSRYFEAEDEAARQRHLRAHLDSLRRHVRQLADKNYQDLYQINSPDYLLLFVPIEPAFSLATRTDSNLFLEALDRNVVLVTTSTLLATMRTVSYIWKQEKQKRSVQEIARQSGYLYDKFVGFLEDMQDIGHRVAQTQHAYRSAMNKLRESPKYGDTLIGRAERIRKLGARARKRIPNHLLDTPGRPSNGDEEE